MVMDTGTMPTAFPSMDPNGRMLTRTAMATIPTVRMRIDSPRTLSDGGTRISDGITDVEDAFVNDPSQSSDQDGDGFGDDPNGTKADRFPEDPTEWSDRDEDSVGDNSGVSQRWHPVE